MCYLYAFIVNIIMCKISKLYISIEHPNIHYHMIFVCGDNIRILKTVII